MAVNGGKASLRVPVLHHRTEFCVCFSRRKQRKVPGPDESSCNGGEERCVAAL